MESSAYPKGCSTDGFNVYFNNIDGAPNIYTNAAVNETNATINDVVFRQICTRNVEQCNYTKGIVENTIECQCGGQSCNDKTGKFCLKSRDACSKTNFYNDTMLSEQTCVGTFCSESQIYVAFGTKENNCAEINGKRPNLDDCICGVEECDSDKRYCYNKRCYSLPVDKIYVSSHVPSCDSQDGEYESSLPYCRCGDSICNNETGILCNNGKCGAQELTNVCQNTFVNESCACGSALCQANTLCYPSVSVCTRLRSLISDVPQCAEGQNDMQCQCRENICRADEYCRFGKCYATDFYQICGVKHNKYDITSTACQKFDPDVPFYTVKDIPLREKQIMYYHEPEHNHYTMKNGIKILLDNNENTVLPIPSESSPCESGLCNSLPLDELNIKSVGREAFANTALGIKQIELIQTGEQHMVEKFSAITKYDAWYGDQQVEYHSPEEPYFDEVVDTFNFSRWTEIADGFYGNDRLDSVICRTSGPYQINIDGRLGVECSDTPICIYTDGTLPTHEKCLCPDKNSLFLGEYNEKLAQKLNYLLEAKQRAENANQTLQNIQCPGCEDAETLLAMNTKFLEIINYKLGKTRTDIDNSFKDPMRYKNGWYASSKSPNVCQMGEFCSSDNYGICLEVPAVQEKRNCDPTKKWPEGTPIVLLHQDVLINNNSDYDYKCNECDQLSGLCKSNVAKLKQKCDGFGTRNIANCFIGAKENGEYFEKKLLQFPNNFFDIIPNVHVRQLLNDDDTKSALIGDGDVYFNNLQKCFVGIKNYADRNSLTLTDFALAFTEETIALDWTTITQYIDDGDNDDIDDGDNDDLAPYIETTVRENKNDVGQKDTFSSNIECDQIDTVGNQVCIDMPNGQSARVVCIENHYRNSSTGNCVACPPQTPARTLTETQCRACPQGKIMQNGFCRACPRGTYRHETDGIDMFTECRTCPKGRHSPQRGMVSMTGTPCLACDVGKIAPETGHFICKWCPIGYGFDSPSTNCVKCSAGRYQDTSELSENNIHEVQTCKICPSGRLLITPKLGCTTCQAGTFFEDNVCKNCATGKYNEGFIECSTTNVCICKYNSEFRNITSGICSTYGYTAITARVTPNDSVCKEGFTWYLKQISHGDKGEDGNLFKDLTANNENRPLGCSIRVTESSMLWSLVVDKKAEVTACKYCPKGFEYADTESLCTSCPNGHYQDSDNTTSPACVVCDPDTEFVGSDAECRLCPENKIQVVDLDNYDWNNFRVEYKTPPKCEFCPGTQIPFLNGFGAKECGPCPETQIYDNQLCRSCAAGFEPDPDSVIHNSRTECRRCPAGKYGTSKGACVNCPAGTTTKNSSQTECTVCTEGYGWNGTTCEQCTDVWEDVTRLRNVTVQENVTVLQNVTTNCDHQYVIVGGKSPTSCDDEGYLPIKFAPECEQAIQFLVDNNKTYTQGNQQKPIKMNRDNHTPEITFPDTWQSSKPYNCWYKAQGQDLNPVKFIYNSGTDKGSRCTDDNLCICKKRHTENQCKPHNSTYTWRTDCPAGSGWPTPTGAFSSIDVTGLTDCQDLIPKMKTYETLSSQPSNAAVVAEMTSILDLFSWILSERPYWQLPYKERARINSFTREKYVPTNELKNVTIEQLTTEREYFGDVMHFNNFSPIEPKQQCIALPCNNTDHFTMTRNDSLPTTDAGWQMKNGALVCDYCPTGKYTTDDKHVCLDIEPGFMWGESSQPKVCPVDEYQDEFGQDECKSCSTGQKSIINEQGKIDTGRPRIDCHYCEDGKKFVNIQGEYECRECDHNEGVEKLSGCTECAEPLKAINRGEYPVCDLCFEDEYLTINGDTGTISCAGGQRNSTTSCILSSDNNNTCHSNTNYTGASIATGHYWDLDYDEPGVRWSNALASVNFSHISKKCPSGSKCELGKRYPCPPGTYQNEEGQTVCTTCPSGYKQQDWGQSSCNRKTSKWTSFWTDYYDSQGVGQQCAGVVNDKVTGKPEYGQECQECTGEEMSMTSFSGVRSCEYCPAGQQKTITHTYNDGRKVYNCRDCSTGKFNPIKGQQCETCPYGIPSDDRKECVHCPTGKSIFASHDYDLDTGTFLDTWSKFKCDICPANHGYDPKYGLCRKCVNPIGSSNSECEVYQIYKNERDQKGVSRTVARSDGKQTMLGCKEGYARKFVSNSDEDVAEWISVDFVNNNVSTSVTKSHAWNQKYICSETKDYTVSYTKEYTSARATTISVETSDGRVVDETIEIPCTKASDTRFGPYGEYKCVRCPWGKTSDADSNNCYYASPGKVIPHGKVKETPCKYPEYSDEFGLTKCKKCPRGSPTTRINKFWLAELQTTGSCEKCPVGKFDYIYTEERCTSCEPGKFQDEEGAVTCKECDAGEITQFNTVVEYGITTRTYSGCESCPTGFTPNDIKSKCVRTNCDDREGNLWYYREETRTCEKCIGGRIVGSSCEPCGPTEIWKDETCHQCPTNQSTVITIMKLKAAPKPTGGLFGNQRDAIGLVTNG
jgi:hypothetical protein